MLLDPFLHTGRDTKHRQPLFDQVDIVVVPRHDAQHVEATLVLEGGGREVAFLFGHGDEDLMTGLMEGAGEIGVDRRPFVGTGEGCGDVEDSHFTILLGQ